MNAVNAPQLSPLDPSRTAPPPRFPVTEKGPDVTGRIQRNEESIERLRNIRSGPPTLEQNPKLRDLLIDRAVHEATEPNPHDNDEGAEIKREYREAYQKTEDGLVWAEGLAEQYGPGTHKLPDGTVIFVREHPFDGSTSVGRREPDGSARRVTYNPEDPTRVEVFERDAEGNETTWKKDGASVSVTRQGEDNSDDQYRLGPIPEGWMPAPPMFQAPNPDPGNPTRTHVEGDVMTVTEVNRDGSTDSRRSDMVTWETNERHTPGRSFDLRQIDWRRAG
ncbi:hypothetical protein DYH09_33630 [bacterium CPR1]|nr:hypothetical protein [bacterium CPR1]